MNEKTNVEVSVRKRELEARVEEVETTLKSLREQLQKEEQAAQHQAIDQLDIVLGEVDNKFHNLREFWKVMRSEWQQLFETDRKDK